MARNQALRSFQDELHLSPSQIRTYLNCSLKYYFQYVAALPPERVSISLHLGSAIHSSLERYYKNCQEGQPPESLSALQEFFSDNLETRLAGTECPVLYKKDMTTRDEATEVGRKLVGTFYENVGQCLDGTEVVAVELPLSATLYSEDRVDTGLKLVGIIDLLLKNREGHLVAVDHKTASKPYAQADVDQDLQLTAYSYLLAANRYVFPAGNVLCRFDVLRKLKTPKLEFAVSLRTAQDRRRFAKVASAVAAGIDARSFLPCRSWLCSDCPYADACSKW